MVSANWFLLPFLYVMAIIHIGHKAFLFLDVVAGFTDDVHPKRIGFELSSVSLETHWKDMGSVVVVGVTNSLPIPIRALPLSSLPMLTATKVPSAGSQERDQGVSLSHSVEVEETSSLQGFHGKRAFTLHLSIVSPDWP